MSQRPAPLPIDDAAALPTVGHDSGSDEDSGAAPAAGRTHEHTPPRTTIVGRTFDVANTHGADVRAIVAAVRLATGRSPRYTYRPFPTSTTTLLVMRRRDVELDVDSFLAALRNRVVCTADAVYVCHGGDQFATVHPDGRCEPVVGDFDRTLPFAVFTFMEGDPMTTVV